MTQRIKQIITSLVLIALLLPGCGPGKAGGVSSSSQFWDVACEDPIPGIHNGYAKVITLTYGSPNGITIVLSCDRATGSSDHGSFGPDAAFEDGYFRLPGDNRVYFRCETNDGTIAKVTIAGHTHDTSNGSLFLISTQSKETQVKQLDADVSNFPKEAVAIKDFAIDNPDIAAFFTDAKNNASVDPEE